MVYLLGHNLIIVDDVSAKPRIELHVDYQSAALIQLQLSANVDGSAHCKVVDVEYEQCNKHRDNLSKAQPTKTNILTSCAN